MPFRLFSALALAALVFACGAPQALASPLQDDEQGGEVEEAFTQTRGFGFGTRPSTAKPATKPPSTSSPKPKPKPPTGAGKAAKGGPNGSGGGSTAKKKNPPTAGGGQPGKAPGDGGGPETKAKPGDDVAAGATPPPTAGDASAPAGGPSVIGLGYTLFMNDPEGNPVVVDPAKEFKTGDKIRVMLEPNTDGFLYIFHAENGQHPQMLYPNVALDEGRNRIEAHARDFVPADLRDAFVFDDTPAIERLYIVLSREPLEGVPTGAQLFEFCGDRRQDCNWTPTPAVWERVKSHASARGVERRHGAPTKISLAKTSIARGLKVKREEPPPTVIRMSSSSTDGLLVTTVDLVHK